MTKIDLYGAIKSEDSVALSCIHQCIDVVSSDLPDAYNIRLSYTYMYCETVGVVGPFQLRVQVSVPRSV